MQKLHFNSIFHYSLIINHYHSKHNHSVYFLWLQINIHRVLLHLLQILPIVDAKQHRPSLIKRKKLIGNSGSSVTWSSWQNKRVDSNSDVGERCLCCNNHLSMRYRCVIGAFGIPVASKRFLTVLRGRSSLAGFNGLFICWEKKIRISVSSFCQLKYIFAVCL